MPPRFAWIKPKTRGWQSSMLPLDNSSRVQVSLVVHSSIARQHEEALHQFQEPLNRRTALTSPTHLRLTFIF